MDFYDVVEIELDKATRLITTIITDAQNERIPKTYYRQNFEIPYMKQVLIIYFNFKITILFQFSQIEEYYSKVAQ